MSNLLYFDYSPWFIFLCLALGIGYSYVQYMKRSPWSVNVNRMLAGLRVVLVTLLAILILGPTIRAIQNFFEKPLLIIAIDNSESLALVNDSTFLLQLKDKLGSIEYSLKNNDWDVGLFDLDNSNVNLDSLTFNEQRSDITGMVKSIQSEYEGSNLSGILLVSDGIFNSGFSPDLISTFTPLYGLGLGDTIPKKDLSIINVRHNKTVYQDNLFPVEIAIRNQGIGPNTVNLKIYQGNTLLDNTNIVVSPDTRLVDHQFLLKATDAGKQRITIQLDSAAGEVTAINNHTSFYIDVVEGQQKVLILADAPTPEIKALRLAIEQNEHFKVEVIIGEDVPDTNYDLIIFINSPLNGSAKSRYTQLANSEIPKLFVLGSRSNYSVLARDQKISFRRSASQTDLVTATINPDFNEFTIASEIEEWLGDAPPIEVPFGDFQLQPQDEVLLYQKVGSINTKKPLIYFSGEEPKQGVILGDGFWTWRLNEYAKYSETSNFDGLISKTIMFLAAKPDNRQFKFYPSKADYEIGDDITFISETYNEIFEPVYGNEVHLKISRGADIKNYTFTPLAGSEQIIIDDLSQGLYNYSAYTTINGKRHQVSGQIAIEKPNLEAADLTADFVAMRKLALESGGKFYTINEFDKLNADFNSLEAPDIIHTQERELLLLNLPWILIMIIVLATGEWLTRKMMGGY